MNGLGNQTNAYLRLIDPDNRHFKWYKIRIEPDHGLFRSYRVIIERGRLGQRGEKLVRNFDSEEAAENYFVKKIIEKEKKGYTHAMEMQPVQAPGCKLCDLLTRSEQDSCFVFEFPKSTFFLNWDQTYRGRSMLVFKEHLEDFFRLSPSDILSILPEIRCCENALLKAFRADRMNYLFMGNQAGHFHLHFVPRYREDPNWGSSPFLDTQRAVAPRLVEGTYLEEAALLRKHIEWVS